MKLRTTPVLALAALLMAGCSSVHLPSPIDQNCVCQSSKPVEVKPGPNGVPIPDPPILLVPRGAKVLTWTLPATSGYKFAGSGITIDGRILDNTVETPRGRAVLLGSAREAFPKDCQVSNGGLQVTCDYRSIGPAAYKYTITVQRGQEPPVSNDPMIVDPL